jgi:signal transduction histidine kinase/ligand-binding sensor domain-containing protein/CheY-like chemotaxis protein
MKKLLQLVQWQNRHALLLRQVGRFCVTIIFLQLFPCGDSYSQNYIFDQFATEDGLPDSHIHSILQDRQGLLWIGTQQGVARVDGQEFTTFSPDAGWPTGRITDIFEDRDGHLWFATGHEGVLCYDGTSLTAFTTREGLPSNYVSAISQDSDGHMWFASWGKGITKWSAEGPLIFAMDGGREDNLIDDILHDSTGRLWLATSKGVFRFHDGVFQLIPFSQGKTPILASTLIEDNQKNIWCGTRSGLWVLNDNRFSKSGLPKTLSHFSGYVRSLLEDRDGRMWVGTAMDGVLCSDNSTLMRYDIANGYPNASTRAMIQDREGILWLGTYAEGLIRFRGAGVAVYPAELGLGNIKSSILEDAEGRILFTGSDHGIFELKDGTPVEVSDPLDRYGRTSLAIDSSSNLWAGSMERGLSVFDGQNWTQYDADDGLLSQRVQFIYTCRNGDIWFAESGLGIGRFDGTSFYHYQNTVDYKGYAPQVICDDDNGHVWFAYGSNGGGLLRFDGQKFISYTTKDGLAGNLVSGLFSDKTGPLWIGTDHGVTVYDGASFEPFTPTDVSDLGHCVFIIGNNRYVFIGTTDGILRWDLDLETATFIPDIVGNVLPDLQQRYATLDKAGRLWLCTRGGIIRILPEHFDKPLPLLPVYITRLQINYNDRPYGDEQDFTYTENNIRFDYSPRHFTYPRLIHFRYRMLGLDTTWVETREHFASYSPMQPGRYQFQVQSRLGIDDWSGTPTSLSITIHPPWWETLWFRLSAGFAFIAGLIGLLHLRTHALINRRKILEQEVLDRTAKIHQQAEALRASQSDLADAQAIARVGNFTIRNDSSEILGSNEFYQIVCWTDLSRSITREEFVNLVAPSDHERVQNAFSNVLQNGKSYNIEFSLLLPNAMECVVHALGKPVYDTQGNIIALRGTLQNITERKQAEKQQQSLETQLRQAQKMESIGRLAGGIAHDFNNILVSIMGFADLLKNEAKGRGDIVEEAADVILKSSGRASDLTQQLLGFARGGKYAPIPLDLNAILHETVKVTEKIFQKNIEVVYNLKNPLPLVEADKNQMSQVFTNLMINAKDAMPNGGTLTLETITVTIDQAHPAHSSVARGHYVQVTVSDSGIGMSADTIQHIFEPFFTTKGEKSGTGLGLAMVYGIVHNHLGMISCSSTPDIGSTFTILLPFTDKEILEETLPEEEIHGDATILVVDDEDTVRMTLKSQLTSLGYTVLLAEDGEEAIDIYAVQQNDIDIVMLDLIMPGLNGPDTYRQLKQMNPGIHALIISGYSEDHDTAAFIHQENLQFVAKPFMRTDLSIRIANILQA